MSNKIKSFKVEYQPHYSLNTEETEFVKNIRKSHCKGCRNELMPCGACAVLDCLLRKTYLPEGEWKKASEYDIHTKHLKEITDDINNRIIEEILKSPLC